MTAEESASTEARGELSLAERLALAGVVLVLAAGALASADRLPLPGTYLGPVVVRLSLVLAVLVLLAVDGPSSVRKSLLAALPFLALALVPPPLEHGAGMLGLAPLAWCGLGRAPVAAAVRTTVVALTAGSLALGLVDLFVALDGLASAALLAATAAVVRTWAVRRGSGSSSDAPLVHSAWPVMALLAVSFSMQGSAATKWEGTIGFRATERTTFAPPDPDWQVTNKIEFGAWRLLAEALGARTRVVEGPLRGSALEDLSALVLINHSEQLGDDEIEVVRDFVRRGGTLVCMADHTDVDGQIAPTNRLLEPVGIALNFDSAVPLDRQWEWGGCARASRHPLTCGDDGVENWGWRIGCSLSLQRSARAILVGTRSFADAGNRANEVDANLGDLERNEGEREGGEVLLAEGRLGRGRVLACGDTSSFQDAVLPRTFPFVARFTGVALGRQGIDAGAWIAAFAAAAWLAAAWSLRGARGALAGLAAGGIALASLAPGADRCIEAVTAAMDARSVVWFDATHGNAYQSPDDEELGIFGLQKGFLRHGRLPLQVRGSLVDALARDPAAFVIVAPRSGYASDELRALDKYLHRGGRVWLFCGRRELERVPELLEHFGIGVGAAPLGSASNATSSVAGEAIDAREAWPVLLDGAETLIEAWGQPMALRRAFGAGELLVVGDPSLFLGSGLEYARRVNERNSRLFTSLIVPWDAGAR